MYDNVHLNVTAQTTLTQGMQSIIAILMDFYASSRQTSCEYFFDISTFGRDDLPKIKVRGERNPINLEKAFKKPYSY